MFRVRGAALQLPEGRAEDAEVSPRASILLAVLLTAWCSGATRAAAEPLERARGWSRLGCPLGESGVGVALAVSGRAQLGRVEILFEDGTIERHELARGHTYRRGLYALASFAGERRVMLVRFETRARSRRADVRAVLMRETADGASAVRSAGS